MAAIINDPTKVYDGTATATLTSNNYALIGFAAGESATVTQTVGTYDSVNAGLRTVNAALNASDLMADSNTSFSNYVLPTSASGVSRISPAPLNAVLVGLPTKTYNGTTAAMLAPNNYSLTGFVAGEGATVTQAIGSYDSANAGARTVTAILGSSDFSANGGTRLANYILPTDASGAGLINRADLAVSITGRPTKQFDGNADATLIPSDYTIAGLVPGEGASITQAHGSYADPSVGVHQVTATLDAGDYAANNGTLLSNYNLPTVASGEGEIASATPTPPTPCAAPSSRDCNFEFPGFPLIIGNPRFFIPYPSGDSVYFAHTNGFAALPSIVWQSSVTAIPGGVLITSGSPIINSAEQIFQQGAADKQWMIMFPPAKPVNSSGMRP
jgi:hypothetical protein